MSTTGVYTSLIAVLVFRLFDFNHGLEIQDVVILILNQQDDFNSKLALELEDSIYKQTGKLNKVPPNVILADTFSDEGHWTISPVLRRLSEDKAEKEWLVVTPGDSVINIEVLLKILQQFNSSSELFLGHAIQDSSPTILHHFSTSQITYPYLPAGIALSRALVHRASALLRKPKTGDAFTIDVAYEFANFLNSSGEGPHMTHVDAFCTDCSSGCAVCPQPLQTCGEPIAADDLYIGVKTFHGYHSDRVPVIKKTWAPYAKQLVFYSDKEDLEIPTKDLGIQNVAQGHCQKTMSILDNMEQIAITKELGWFAIVDDDTILSVGRLRQLLSCYDPSEPVVIGERYGYFATEPHGYAYPTGGAGMIFSAAAVKIIASGQCNCPSLSAPDDMHIGLCLQRYSIPIVHSPLFHQARPMDYAVPATPSRPPITFHKHFLIDPHEIYTEHFEVVDKEVTAMDSLLKNTVKRTGTPTIDNRHTEL